MRQTQLDKNELIITLNKDKKQTKYGNKRREHMTHTTEDWYNSRLPEGANRAVTVLPGRGGGHSVPSGHTWTGYRTEASRAEQTGWRPWQGSPRPGHHSRSSTTPPPKKIKKSMGQLGGIRSPPGLNTQDRTAHRARQNGQDSPSHRNRKPSLARLGSWGFFLDWRGVRGPHRGPQQPLPLRRQGGRRDESPWTWLTR